jgi:hypothetical protein
LRGVPADLPFVLEERTIAMGDSFTFETAAGNLDCLGTQPALPDTAISCRMPLLSILATICASRSVPSMTSFA